MYSWSQDLGGTRSSRTNGMSPYAWASYSRLGPPVGAAPGALCSGIYLPTEPAIRRTSSWDKGGIHRSLLCCSRAARTASGERPLPRRLEPNSNRLRLRCPFWIGTSGSVVVDPDSFCSVSFGSRPINHSGAGAGSTSRSSHLYSFPLPWSEGSTMISPPVALTSKPSAKLTAFLMRVPWGRSGYSKKRWEPPPPEIWVRVPGKRSY